MNRALSISFLLMSLLLAAVSCSDNTLPDPDADPIEFGLSFTAEAKGSELTTYNISSFGVFAALEDDVQNGFDRIDASKLQLFMDDVPVTKTDGSWSATPPHYWPILEDKSLSFFAYAPHSSAGTGIVAEAGWGQDELPDKTIEITYTLAPDPADHVDLCVAKAVLDRVSDSDGDGDADPVSFGFEHTLAWVSFAANYIGNLPAGCDLKIDELSIRNIAVSGVLKMNSSQEGDSFFSWEELTEKDKNGSITLSVIGETLESNVPLPMADENNNNHVNFATAKGALFVMPQSVNPETVSVPAVMDLTFSYIRKSDNAAIAQFYTQLELPESEWVVAEKTKYIFTVDVTTASLIKISAVSGGAWVNDWQESGNNHEEVTIK